MTKIPCGGFYIDDETLGINEDGKLSVIGGGGGSSIPTPVFNDAGKVLTAVVDQEHTVDYVILEEQTVTTDEEYGEADLEGFSSSIVDLIKSFIENSINGVLTINGVSYTEPFYFQKYGDISYPAIKHGDIMIVWHERSVFLSGNNETTYTVSVSAISPATIFEWQDVPMPWFAMTMKGEYSPSTNYTIAANTTKQETFTFVGQSPGYNRLLDVKITTSPVNLKIWNILWSVQGDDIRVTANVENIYNEEETYKVNLSYLYNYPVQCSLSEDDF